jgi:hypothetical protein
MAGPVIADSAAMYLICWDDILGHRPIANPEQIVDTAALGLQINAGNMIDVDSHGSDHNDDLGNGDLDRVLPI